MNHLFIVAHPDDEILGAGGTIIKLKQKGERVAVLIFSQNSRTRELGLKAKVFNIHAALGIDRTYLLDYEMMKFSEYDRFKMTQDIERVIQEEKADVLYIHDFNDVHNDHRELSQISMEAAKLPQRSAKYAHSIKSIYTIEVPSSTDWGAGFVPNAFFEISYDDILTKEKMLSLYDDVIRDVPHPRNRESFLALARYRGGMCGVRFAEAFRKVFELQAEGD